MRERVLAAARVFGDVVEIDFPTAESVVPAFMREVGDVHRDLYDENGELYGENIRGKIERCLALTDARVSRRGDERARHREARRGGARRLRPAARADAGVRPAAGRRHRDRDPRRADAVHVPVQRARAGRRSRSPSERPRRACRRRLQIVGRRGDDGVVLAAGLALEASL